MYANDWFLIPFQLPVGAIAKIRGMAVTNVFGERTWIDASGSGTDENWQRLSMFTINTTAIGDPADTSLLLMPASPTVMDGAPFEDIMLVRDEMANMVWGIERAILLPSGGTKPGTEVAIETVQYFKRLLRDEEEVPRTGTRATLAFRRARSKSGKPYIWLAVRKETGRGEAWSGLAFDRIVDEPAAAS